VAIVAGGSFQYRSAATRGGTPELMTPGSLFLGNRGQCFECGHEHAAGDRCISFRFAPEYFERIAADAGGSSVFRARRIPALRATSALVAQASAAANRALDFSWEETAIRLAAQAAQLDAGIPDALAAPRSSFARVTRAVRCIESDPRMAHTVASLAAEARLSPYHFLRTFERLTGLTPHQFVLRVRLREAAARLSRCGPRKVLDIALDCGFGDVSNFNRTFRAEFGRSPRVYRAGA
jgi:AraC-like DNA-binding protein